MRTNSNAVISVLLLSLANQFISSLALRFENSTIRTSSTKLGEVSLLEQIWTIYREHDSESVTELQIALPARVFIKSDSDSQTQLHTLPNPLMQNRQGSSNSAESLIGHVRVLSNSEDILRLIIVTDIPNSLSMGVSVQLRNTVATVRGALLTEIFLHQDSLSRIENFGIGDISIAPNVLVNGNAVVSYFGVHSSGNMELNAGKVNPVFKELTLEASDSGKLAIEANVLTLVEDLKIRTSEDGTMMVIGQDRIVTQRVDVESKSSARTYIAGGKSFQADQEINITSLGKGNIAIVSVDLPGDCHTEKVTIDGKGSVNLESFVSKETHATLSSDGDLTVQTRQLLEATVTGSGKVYYVNDKPQIIKSSASWYFWRKGGVQHKASVSAQQLETITWMNCVPLMISLVLATNTEKEDGTQLPRIEHYSVNPSALDNVQLGTADRVQGENTWTNSWKWLMVIGACVAGASMLVIGTIHAVQYHRRRAYEPLLARLRAHPFVYTEQPELRHD
uniref:Uncharacterized protein AlNc14C740G12475 n=1 Tax=Albugo laibachii Nc14 TaxID=890382 RepID=F0X1Z6_9STRA|nr:conserved hypothetical protein [Albugo laibachii Nc14]|eukprot:CCA27855.1 conserved hypothetical protein [Albugo laibachii Nc14]